MGKFRKLVDFESRFPTMDIAELKDWRAYWTWHAQWLAPKVRKAAMKRVYEIDKAIRARDVSLR